MLYLQRDVNTLGLGLRVALEDNGKSGVFGTKCNAMNRRQHGAVGWPVVPNLNEIEVELIH